MEQALPIPVPPDRKLVGHVLRGLAALAEVSETLQEVPAGGLTRRLRNLRAAVAREEAQEPATVPPTYRGYKSTYPEYAALRTAQRCDSDHRYRMAQVALVASLAKRTEMAANESFLDRRRIAGLACRRAARNETLRRRIDQAAEQTRRLRTFGERLHEQAQAYKLDHPIDAEVPRHLDAIARLTEYACDTKLPSSRRRGAPHERQIRRAAPDDDTQIDAELLVDRRDATLIAARKAAGTAPTGEQTAGNRQGGVTLDRRRESRGKSPKQRYLRAAYLSRSITTRNQHLPAASDRLQLHDLQILFEGLRSPSDRKGLAAAQEKEVKESMAMSLLFGASAATLLTIRTAATENELGASEPGIPWLVLQFAPIFERARSVNLPVRGYVSCAIRCPYQGDVHPESVLTTAYRLLGIGCYAVSIGEPQAGPGLIMKLLDTLLASLRAERLALHCHNTFDEALPNILAGLDRGIRAFDSSIAGLWGCPYAIGASGNRATENRGYVLDGLGYRHGTDLNALVATGQSISRKLNRENQSTVGIATLERTKCPA